MNKELVLILKELKKASEIQNSCFGTNFRDFSCTNVDCPQCILSNVNKSFRYSSQIVLVNL